MDDSTAENPADNSVTFSEFQQLIREMYFDKDVARGIPGTFMWLMEEVGELSSALRENDYENQVENEFMACTFIDSVLWNSYTETGEIDIDSKQDVVISETTPLQALVLSLLSITIAGLAGTIIYMRRRIKTQFPSFVKRSSAQLA